MSKRNDFAMDYEAVQELANQIHNIQADFAQMLSSLNDLVASVDGQWKGKAQVEFATAYSKLKPKLNTISDVLQNYATAINTAVAGEQELESFSKTLYTPVSYPSF